MQKNTDSVYYNKSGYPDPTAGKAINNIDEKPIAKRRKRHRRKRKVNIYGAELRKEFLQ